MTDTLVLLTPDHRYIHVETGRQVPSVSSILRKSRVRDAPFGYGQPGGGGGARGEAMARALQRGTEVHRLTRAIDETVDFADAFDDTFDPADISEENLNYVSAYERFIRLSGYRPIAWEVVLFHAGLWYAGRADAVGWLGHLRVLIDRKTDRTLNRAVWLQLGFYRMAWNVCHPNEPIDKTYALKLNADMTFELVPNPLEPADESFCLAALWMAKWADLVI